MGGSNGGILAALQPNMSEIPLSKHISSLKGDPSSSTKQADSWSGAREESTPSATGRRKSKQSNQTSTLPSSVVVCKLASSPPKSTYLEEENEHYQEEESIHHQHGYHPANGDDQNENMSDISSLSTRHSKRKNDLLSSPIFQSTSYLNATSEAVADDGSLQPRPLFQEDESASSEETGSSNDTEEDDNISNSTETDDEDDTSSREEEDEESEASEEEDVLEVDYSSAESDADCEILSEEEEEDENSEDYRPEESGNDSDDDLLIDDDSAGSYEMNYRKVFRNSKKMIPSKKVRSIQTDSDDDHLEDNSDDSTVTEQDFEDEANECTEIEESEVLDIGDALENVCICDDDTIEAEVVEDSDVLSNTSHNKEVESDSEDSYSMKIQKISVEEVKSTKSEGGSPSKESSSKDTTSGDAKPNGNCPEKLTDAKSEPPPVVCTVAKNKSFRREGSVRRGQWSLGSKIGVGSFGVVYVGMNKQTGTLMAVKSVQLEKAAMKDVRREINLLKTLEHINIVRYLGAERDATHLHIFQEWVPGGSVSSLLQKFGPFSMPVVRSYLIQILSGLTYLHEHKILHRDIKGGNVLVNDVGVVKLADFGASRKLAQQASEMESLTMRGTPYFMAPEVFEELYGSAADIWSVGCVAFQMASGTPPWKSMGFTNPMSLFMHLKKEEGPPLLPTSETGTEKKKEIGLFQSMLTKCFAREPSLRPNASAMLQEDFFSDIPMEEEQSPSRDIFSPGAASNASWETSLPNTVGKPPRTPNDVKVVIQSNPFASPPFLPSSVRYDKLSFDGVSPLLSSSLQVDSKEWPTWAKKKMQSQKVRTDENQEALNHSLAISEDSSMPEENPFRRQTERSVGSVSTLNGLMFVDEH